MTAPRPSSPKCELNWGSGDGFLDTSEISGIHYRVQTWYMQKMTGWLHVDFCEQVITSTAWKSSVYSTWSNVLGRRQYCWAADATRSHARRWGVIEVNNKWVLVVGEPRCVLILGAETTLLLWLSHHAHVAKALDVFKSPHSDHSSQKINNDFFSCDLISYMLLIWEDYIIWIIIIGFINYLSDFDVDNKIRK